MSAFSRQALLRRRWTALKSERTTWLSQWREIAEHMRPRGFREQRSDVNRGDKKHSKVINFTPLEAQRTLVVRGGLPRR